VSRQARAKINQTNMEYKIEIKGKDEIKSSGRFRTKEQLIEYITEDLVKQIKKGDFD